MDKSWVSLDRRSQEYREKLEIFLTKAFEKSSHRDKIICPCKKCCNRYYNDKVVVGGHLLWHGMDPRYMNARWTHHGEPYIDPAEEGDPYVVPNDGEQMNSIDQGDDAEVYELLNETFVQPLVGDTVGSSRQQPIFEDQSPEAEKYYKLLKEADKELYPGSKKYKKLDAVLKLYQIKCLGHVSNSIFSMFLEAFKDMLPDGDCLPKSYQQAKKIIDDLSLPCEKIDACPNDCMLFWKDTSNLTECSRCGASRYIVTTVKDNFGKVVSVKKTSAKILRYFPLIPRLKRLYMSRHTAEHMRWHATECPKDEFMRHPSDSPAWKHLDALYPDFASEIRNVRLGLASDGFNPFSNMTKPHSTWPVIISVYNLPPWMCMKQPYMYMSLLIPGPKEPGNDIDVYLRPLLDELKELWEVGTSTYDVYSNQTFNMKAALLWTINDFPAYAKLSGWSTSGKFACPKCNHQTCSVRLRHSKKNCYPGSRRFLPSRHRWRNDGASFNGKSENGRAPVPLSGTECLRKLSNLAFTYGKIPETQPVVGQKRRRSSEATREPTAKSPWKKKSIFYTLPYWEHLLIRHNIDVMHVEKNVCEILVGTILALQHKMKDTPVGRIDLEEWNIRPSLYPVRFGERTYIPPAIFSMTSEEKMLFFSVLAQVRVPDGYSTNIARCVNVKEKKIQGLKSHDYHVIMQQLLPLAIRRALPKPVTRVLLELSAIFRKLCSKKESEASFKKLQCRAVIALCMMEKMFPPSFFVVMVHLVIHLADEAAIAGPVHYRWMYPIERYIQTLKRYVRNKSCPEGSIAVGYLAEETLSFCSMYLKDIESRQHRHGRNADVSSPRDVAGGLSIFANSGHSLGKGTNVDIERSIWEQCHRYVLFNCDEVSPFLQQRLTELKKLHPRKSIRDVEVMRNKEFPTWFKDHVSKLHAVGDSSISDDLRRLANGPKITVRKYKKYVINGCRFRVKSVDDKYKNQNCGVFLSAETSSYSSVRDRNPIIGNVDYFGLLKDIYELDYRFPGESNDQACKIVLFECDWVTNSGKKFDQYGFTLVNFNRLAQNTDKFLLASQATQVFYVADPKETDWSVVVKIKPRDFFDVMEDGTSGGTSALDLDDYYTIPNLDDPNLDNEVVHTRTDIHGRYINKLLPMPVRNAQSEQTDDDEDEEEEEEEDQ